MGPLDIFVGTQPSPIEELAAFVKHRILKKKCPVCHLGLDSRHNIARIGACNFNGPNPRNGFVDEIDRRDWGVVIEPFDRLTSMDMMACEVVRCPQGTALIVWVEVDLVGLISKYPVRIEKISGEDLGLLEKSVAIRWQAF